MQEIKYIEIKTRAEDGRPLSLAYHVLVDKQPNRERYGLKVTDKGSGEFALALDLTDNSKRIYDMVDKLAKHAVTPTTLADVVADGL